MDLADDLRAEKRAGNERRRLEGRNIALIFEKTSTRTLSSFEVAAHDQGASTTYLGPEATQLGHKESMKDTARVLGRMFDGICYRGFSQEGLEELQRHAGVPVWNALTDEWHPTQTLADVLTMRDHVPLERVAFCYLGDARNNMANSLLVTGGAPRTRRAPGRAGQPVAGRRGPLAGRVAGRGLGARLTVTEDVGEAVLGVDFVYTDVWVSMGEPPERWDDRIDLLLPYQVNASVMAATGNPDVRFLHCLPAFHDTRTVVGRSLFERRGLEALEVTDEVFESPASLVFEQAENRLHTIKALLVATLSG